MKNIAEVFVLLYLSLTFLQSAYDKIFDWKGNVEWLKSHFSKTFLNSGVPAALGALTFMELVSGIFSLAAAYVLFFYDNEELGLWAAILSAITFMMLLFGQRIAKDYDGARTIVIYFIPNILLLYWLA
jgi:hypothetical protein